MLKRALLIAALAAGPLAAQEPRVYIRTPGPGKAQAVLQDALAHPYVVRHERFNTRLFRDSVFDRTVLVLGSDATVASTVHGDVVVVGGNLFLRPGAVVDGRAVAIGGGVYRSAQATVHGAELSFRDAHYDVSSTPEGIALDYREPLPTEIPELVSFPVVYGLRIPTYSRVDGLSLPWGPRFALGRGRVVIDPTLTYRSDLGAFDGAATLSARLGAGWTVQLEGGRGTFSNDRWIQSDLANSLTTLVRGADYRNWWRADRFEGRLGHDWTGENGEIGVWGGARTERDWSVSAGGPWSFAGQHTGDGIHRPNPVVEPGRLTSALAGISGALSLEQLSIHGAATVERALDAPAGERFTQGTIDALVEFPTFGTQSFAFRSHVVLTAGDTAPPQRWSYLGGSGTLPTRGLLSQGGDRLALFEGRYIVPLDMIPLPLVGAPTVSVRYLLGSAGVGHLPAFAQDLGVRLTVRPFRFDFDVDPDTHQHAFAAGLAIVR